MTIIIPNCLKVDNAITFFKSDSKTPQMLEHNIVKTPLQKIKYKLSAKIKSNMRNKKKTPAVTKVDEWTSEETGVGAAIAKGSHLEKGNCALFVNLAKTKIKIMFDVSQHKNFQPPILTLKKIPISKNTSPIRLLSTVSMPEFKLLELP